MVPSIALRQGYLEKVHLAQIKSEKDAILSHIGQLQPGVRDTYLRQMQRFRLYGNLLDMNAEKGIGPKEDPQAVEFRKRMVQYEVDNFDKLKSGKHADFLYTRNAELTKRIPNKAVGL